MNQQYYDEEYEEVQRELHDIEEEKADYQLLRQKLSAEEEHHEKEIAAAMQLNEDIEHDWKNRNMLGEKQYLFEEEDILLRKINSERSSLCREDYDDLKQYMKKLLCKEEMCQENLSRLQREYREDKEEKDNGTYY